jgi:hypothetical protein
LNIAEENLLDNASEIYVPSLHVGFHIYVYPFAMEFHATQNNVSQTREDQ